MKIAIINTASAPPPTLACSLFRIRGWVNKYPQTAGKSENLMCPFLPPPAITGSSAHQYSFISEPRNFSHSFFLQASLAQEEARLLLKCLPWHKYRGRKWKALNWLCKCTGPDRGTDAHTHKHTHTKKSVNVCPPLLENYKRRGWKYSDIIWSCFSIGLYFMQAWVCVGVWVRPQTSDTNKSSKLKWAEITEWRKRYMETKKHIVKNEFR